MDYVVLGCLSIDNTINAKGIKKLRQFGGNAAYGAGGMRLWEPGKIGIVSRKGTDIPDTWMEELRHAGIDIEGIRSVPLRHMMFSGMVYDEKGDRRELVFNENINAETSDDVITGFPNMTPEMVTEAHENFAPKAEDIPDSYGDAKAVMICARHYDRQVTYAEYFRRHNQDAILIMDTGKDYMNPASRDRLPALFSLMDVVIPSEVEVRDLLGNEISMEDAARELAGLGAKNVVIKVGRRGCITYNSKTGEMHHVPVYNAQVEDPTGAGDSFCGGFTVGMKETGDLVKAAMYGAVSSSFIIEHFSVVPSLGISRAEAEKRLRAIEAKMMEESKL